MAHSKNNALPITPRMREAFDAVVAHGTRDAAAEQLGITSRAVSMLVVAYCDRAGVQPPYRGSRPYALSQRLVAAAEAKAADAERSAELLRSERPLPFVPSHRRVADGGRTVRQQRREWRAVA